MKTWITAVAFGIVVYTAAWLVAYTNPCPIGGNASLSETVLTRLGLKEAPDCMNDWDGHVDRPNWEYLDAEACTQDHACTLTSAGSFDGGSAASTAPCKKGSSLPGTCNQSQCFVKTGDGTVWFCTATNTWTQLSITTGTVTSVGLALPNIFTVSGSPVTSTGDLTGTLASQSQNLVFASPNGSSGTPTFRALVNADLPGGNAYATVKEEGSSLTQRTAVNFIGALITCADNSGSSRTDCTVASAYSTVDDEGSGLTQRPTVNFIGAGVSCTDNSGSSRTDCTIPGGGGYDTVKDEGTSLTQRPVVNFTGSGITCTDNGGSTRTDCDVPGATGTGYTTVKDETSSLTQRDTIAFKGTGVTCVDNASQTECTIPSGVSTVETPGDTAPGSPGSLDDECNGAVSGSWSSVNMGSSTVASATYYCDMTAVATSGASAAMQCQTAPSTPYTIIARIANGLPANSANNMAGLVLRNSTSSRLFSVASYHSTSGAYALVSLWSSSTARNSNPYNNPFGGIEYFKLEVTSTTVKAYVSTEGRAWTLLRSETLSDYLTATGGSADQDCWFASDETSSTDGHALLYFFRNT